MAMVCLDSEKDGGTVHLGKHIMPLQLFTSNTMKILHNDYVVTTLASLLSSSPA